MKLTKNIWRMYILLVFAILLSDEVESFGISPASEIINFQSDLEGTASFKIINSEHKSMRVLVYTDYSQEEFNLTINNSELLFHPSDQEKIVTYNYILPEEFREPGIHEFHIVIREVPVSSEINGTVIDASVAVEHVFKVNVPYPGKYATTELKVSETNKEGADFIVIVNNLGSEQIVNAQGLIEIYDSKNEKVITLETPLVNVDSGSRKEIMVGWDAEVIPGEYKANLNLMYEGKTAKYSKSFQIGEANVNLLHIYSNKFKLGQIAKFNILIENRWSEKIYDVYTDLLISENGQKISEFKSATEEIAPMSNKELIAYWDSEGVNVGEYDVKILLHYNDKTIERDMRTKIAKDSISFSGFSGAVVSDSPLNSSNIIAFGIIIVIINAIWIIYFKIKNKKK